MSFQSLGLPQYLVETLEKREFEKPYPIQEQVIPATLKGDDIMGIAPTGSGKTASYVLPILSLMEGETKTKNRHVSVLIMVPTRELAVQVKDVFRQMSMNLPERVKVLAVFGGVSINPQMIAMQNTKVLIATPGRLIELVESNAVQLKEVKMLVLDEADKMLSMGFKAEMDRIFGFLPKKRQNLLFSATLNKNVKGINRALLNDPTVVKIGEKKTDLTLINQTGYFVSPENKGPLLRYIIKSNNLDQVLIFVASTFKADSLVDKLKKNGIQANAIHGKKSQGARTEALRRFKSGNLRVLVATDLLARGIDIEFLPCVINYELPRSPKDYIHRIGRTGRAENPGDAISLITPEEQHHFKVIQKKMGRWVDMIDSARIDFQGY